MRSIRLIYVILFVIVSIYTSAAQAQKSNVGQSKPIVAVLTRDTEYLPPYITSAAVEIDILEAAEAPDDVVVISRTTLLLAASNEELRVALIDIALHQKLLLVRGASLTELKRQLDIQIPTVTTETTGHVVAGITWMRNGRAIVGGILTSRGLENEIQSFQDYANYVKSIMLRYDKGAVIDNTFPPGIVLIDRSYLPIVLRSASASYWDPYPIIAYIWEECPFGKYNEIIIGQKQANDGTALYDFWGIEIQQQTIGGKSICSDSDYRTSRLWTRADVTGNGGLLYKYGPTTTNPDLTASIDIGIVAGYKEAAANLGWGWSFALPSVSVIDHSDFALNWAEWEFQYNINTNPAIYTFLSQPGVAVRLPQTSRPLIYRPLNMYWATWLSEVHIFDNWYVDFAVEVVGE